jgi:propionyl-CoA carboxylase alpha chain
MKPITCVLVANRGEIASRIFRTCRSLGIRTVAVYSEPDRFAPYVSEADVAVALGGSTAAESYLRTDFILDAARRTGADAIHPGYGFLSENAGFAAAVVEAGIIWIGPTPANITAMGTKVEAKALAAAAGVPTLPSATIEGDDTTQWLSIAESVGYPLLVKANSGGGGKGMRSVFSPGELIDAVVGARREAAASFGDPKVFVERLLVGPRHIEIQVFGDTHGNVIHLYERECSIQRRHQKIIEEAPSPALNPTQRAAMGTTAVALAKAIGYEGAGTVEYLFDDASGEFFFLEMNTRLQVEHPVTECITGTDLVAWQLTVASGGGLPLTQEQVELRGHAIEVRLYAEDPSNDFLPSMGILSKVLPAGRPGIRWDSGVESGSVVSPFYDPMLAKVIAHAPSRTQAAAMLRGELAESHIHGLVTNAPSLVAILGHPAFLSGDTSTAFLSQHPEVLIPKLSDEPSVAHLAAVVAELSTAARAADTTWGFAPSGWRSLPTQFQSVTLVDAAGVQLDIRYRSVGLVEFEIILGEHTVLACVVGRSRPQSSSSSSSSSSAGSSGQMVPDQVVRVDGLTTHVCVTRQGAAVWANSTEGQSTFTVADRFPLPDALASAGGPTAPVPGRVVAVNVAVGDAVVADQVLVVVEAMKMEHSIRSAGAGVVTELRVAVGDQVEARELLVIVS